MQYCSNTLITSNISHIFPQKLLKNP